MRKRWTAAGVLRTWVAAALIALPSTAAAGTFVAFGPENYVRGTGDPVPVTKSFTVLNPNTSYTIRINNGGLTDGEFEPVSSSVFVLNGVQIVGPNEFNQNVTVLDKPVTLVATNELTVELRGKPGGGVTVQIFGVDNDPPSITAAVNPPPNTAGWNNTNVTVTFTCADTTSGIATCPSPVLVDTEGANQVVSGTAVDRAGNTASTSVTLNIDKTRPAVTITSPPSLSLFAASPITVSGTSDDPGAPVVVNGIQASVSGGTFTATGVPLREGSNLLTAVATDQAGNVATSSITVVLDTTPPTVLIDSPSNGAIVIHPTITVTGMINDSVVGTVNADNATVTVNGIPAQVSNRSFVVTDLPLQRGPNLLTAIGQDRAGNTSSHTITVTFLELLGQRINLVSGNNHTGVIGTALANPLVVSLTDANGAPAPGRTVTFTVSRGDGVLNADSQQGRSLSALTDAAGRASVLLTLGTRAGAGSDRVTARAPGFVGEVIFSASAVNSVPAQIKTISGETQRGVVGEPLPRPFVVFVHDEGGNPVAGVPVIFEVVQGEGTIEGNPAVTVPTDSDGRAAAILTLGPAPGVNNNIVQARFDGMVGLPATLTASGVIPGSLEETTVSGVVLDNSNVPIEGVTARILGTTLQAVTDAQGQFTIASAPVGALHLHVDGTTTTRPGVWPFLEFELTTIAGLDNTVGMPIYLLPLDDANAKIVGGSEDVTLTMKDVPGFALTVFANSATFADGSRVGRVMVTQVHHDKVPMPPIGGAAPRLVWTVQPAGVRFDPPARVTYPNLHGLKPGQVVDIFSFDHDLGQFVSIGTGKVSEDGSAITSCPGVGIRKAGWGYPGAGPPRPTTDPEKTPDPCQASADATAEVARQFAATNPNAVPFANIQACIGSGTCGRAAPGPPDFDSNTWAETIVPKFIKKFLDGASTPNSEWQDILRRCAEFFPFFAKLRCARLMAEQHIEKDLPIALLEMEPLKKKGLVPSACGTQRDWDTVFGDINSCVQSEPNLDPLSNILLDLFGPGRIEALRDKVRENCRRALGE